MPATAPFAPSVLDELARRLERRRLRSAQLATSLQHDAARALEDLDVSDLLDSDNPDAGSNDVDRAHALLLAELASTSVTAADAALARVASGAYGICVGCGERIPLARLRALPETEVCAPCKVAHGQVLRSAG